MLNRSQPMSPLTGSVLAILSVAQMALSVERQEVTVEQKKEHEAKKGRSPFSEEDFFAVLWAWGFFG